MELNFFSTKAGRTAFLMVSDSHKTCYPTYTVNLNFCCWCVTARESTSSSARAPEVLLPSLLSQETSLQYEFSDLTGATVQLLLLTSSSVCTFHPQLQMHTEFRGKKNLLVKASLNSIIFLSRVVIKSPLPIARTRGSLFSFYNVMRLH